MSKCESFAVFDLVAALWNAVGDAPAAQLAPR
jgi:hypothetical protein